MSKHISILKDKIIEVLFENWEERSTNWNSNDPLWIVDCTFGGGGHTRALIERLDSLKAGNSNFPSVKILGVDQDRIAIMAGERAFESEISAGKLELQNTQMSKLEDFFRSHAVVGVVADLGFSSDQIDDPSRGLSFKHEGPLDFRLSQESDRQTAWEFLQDVNESELSQILRDLGDERFSKGIARSIKSMIIKGELKNSTSSLVQAVVRGVPAKFRHGRIHVATKTFQALRIYINHEAEELDSLLSRVIISLRQGGRMAVLTFHSGEDRKVKHWLKSQRMQFRPLSKKPILPEAQEFESNPRSRSAKLRVAEKVS